MLDEAGRTQFVISASATFGTHAFSSSWQRFSCVQRLLSLLPGR